MSAVMVELLSVDTSCFVPWGVCAFNRCTHFVPFIPSMSRLDIGDSASGERGALREGDLERETVASTARNVPAVPYWAPRTATFCGRARLVGPAAVDFSSP